MKLSVVIVNYNVQHFLEQCLHSVRRAIRNVEGEIFVVDNNSVDGSVRMVREKFPEVHLIANKENTGFSKANNQAIQVAKGEYILLLNPDTVVAEDTFEKVIRFMDEHPDAGGLGVKMVDGKGNFLPESKRGLPTPAVAFYKIFGLSALFPASRTFGRYHLGFLDKDKNHEVDVLSGAFMLLRKTALEKTGLLDEAFFMYGEDIDLSYRITKAGYKNYYFSGTKIIHYKGESTKKSSVNYVFVFYRAMIIFARKHFSQNNAKLFSFLINAAIYLRAGIAIAARFVRKAMLPLTDAALILGGLFFIKSQYEKHVLHASSDYFSENLINIAFPLYIVCWLFSMYLSGGYDKPVKLLKIIRGLVIGTGFILIVYSLLPERYRFSRALILLGSAWAMVAVVALRILLHALKVKGFSLITKGRKRIVVVGEKDECDRVSHLLSQTSVNPGFTGFVSVDEDTSLNGSAIGKISQLKEIIGIYKIDEVIFCAKDIPAHRIIDSMTSLGESNVDFKIAPPESLSVIGSNSINTAGDLYVIDVNSITRPVNRRNKRILDITVSAALLAGTPLFIFFMRRPVGFVANIFRVLAGQRSWVGYGRSRADGSMLPSIRNGVLSPADAVGGEPGLQTQIDMVYAKDYRLGNDLQIIWKGFRELGRR